MRVLLISTYELGRQPFGLASPAAWIRQTGVDVECLDLALEKLDENAVRRADAVGFYLPMHTATRIALAALPKLRDWNSSARLFAWGLYAPVCAAELRGQGVDFLAGGEFELDLLDFLQNHLGDKCGGTVRISHERLDFRVPDRTGLPPLRDYAHLCMPDGTERIVGATEASRGCKHLCRHCPVVPVYNGRFRVVQPEVVLADVAQQVEAGAQHITFGDPDFLNGPRHAMRVVEGLQERFPGVTYDVTVKIEHILDNQECLPTLRDTGCVLVTSAVESIDDHILRLLDKGHTRDDFVRAVELCRNLGLHLQPTFVAFNPWTGLEGYAELLAALVELDLVGQVTPIQLAIRLLIPRGSRLLELPEVVAEVGPYEETLLVYPWAHRDPRVDALQRQIEQLVADSARENQSRGSIFERVWEVTWAAAGASSLPDLPNLPARATIPYLTEPWYC